MSRSPLVSIVIVNYNTQDETLACLESLETQDIPGGFEVVLVDNGSSDGSVAAIRREHPTVQLVEAGENLGFARGVNLGAARSRGEYVLLLNPDTVVLPGSLAAMVSFALENPEYGLYGGRTLRFDGSLVPGSCFGEPSLWSLTCLALGLSTVFRGSPVFDPESLGRWQRDSVRVVPVITGCLLLVSRVEWERLGGMDETYFLYGEDVDFSMRARSLGLRPVIVPDAVIHHDVGGSTPAGGLRMCMVMAGKSTLYRRQWTRRRATIGVGLLQAATLTRAAGEVLTGRRSRRWVTVWRRRRDWRVGYPGAKATIFGLPSEPRQ